MHETLPQMNNSLPQQEVTNRTLFIIDVRYKLRQIMEYFPKFPLTCPGRKPDKSFENP